MRIYIAGPITGDPDFLKKFTDAEEEIRAHYAGNVEIVNPAYMDKTLASFSHRKQVDFCLQLLSECDMIYLLEGWENSTGAQAEYGFAKARNIVAIEQKLKSPVKSIIEGNVEELRKAAVKMKAKEAENAGEKKYTHICKVCGKTFETSKMNNTICSAECREQRIKQKNKEWHEEHRVVEKVEEKKKDGKIRPNRIHIKEAEARKQGKHYADLQKEQTLELIRKGEL